MNHTELLLEFKSIPRHKRVKTFMEISGYPHYENVCSNILEFYLDPNNEHGLKDLVLNSLVRSVNKDFKFDIDYEKIEVYREILTNKGNRLDLLIKTGYFAIGIENKIFHHLQNDLTDYRNTINLYCEGFRTPIYIVLSLNKLTNVDDLEKMRSNQFVNITYGEVFQNIKHSIGKYLSSGNLSYINHLTDFVKSIENLVPTTMENTALRNFFKNNSEAIQELADSFIKYKESFYQKVYQLQTAIPQNEFAPTATKQWIYDKFCLVHDYLINDKYQISVDTISDVNNIQIQLFGRDNESTDFLFGTMCKNEDFLPEPVDNYRKTEDRRLIIQNFDGDIDLTIVVKSLTDLLTRIENYKKK